ncbi:MAG TPA: alpha/beta fold hydrolase [Gammaproteobacteria bacterium]
MSKKIDPKIDSTRRTLLATGAAAAAVAATKRAFAQRNGEGAGEMAFFERGDVRIHYYDSGSGFPLLLIPGGGLNSVMSYILEGRAPFNPMEEFGDAYRYIVMDLRNAVPGQSSGPLEIDRPWDSHTDDQLALLDHLGVDQFMVLGFCIGGPFIWNLLERAPDRIPAAVLAQPVGYNRAMPNYFVEGNTSGWGAQIREQRPEITQEMVDTFVSNMYGQDDFVFTVSRDFVSNCETPVLILPDDVPAHPFDTAMEVALLAPNAQVSLFPWKQPEDRIPLAVRHIRSFLKEHRPG